MSLLSLLCGINRRSASHRPEAVRLRPQLEVLERRDLPSLTLPSLTPFQQQVLVIARDVATVAYDGAKAYADVGLLEGGVLVSAFASNWGTATQFVQVERDWLALGKDFQTGANLATVTGHLSDFLIDESRLAARWFGGAYLALVSDATQFTRDAFQLGQDIAKLGNPPSPAPQPQPTPQPSPEGGIGGGPAVDFDNDGDSDFGGLIDSDHDPVFTR
jgi:hypothetical protein